MMLHGAPFAVAEITGVCIRECDEERVPRECRAYRVGVIVIAVLFESVIGVS